MLYQSHGETEEGGIGEKSEREGREEQEEGRERGEGEREGGKERGRREGEREGGRREGGGRRERGGKERGRGEVVEVHDGENNSKSHALCVRHTHLWVISRSHALISQF